MLKCDFNLSAKNKLALLPKCATLVLMKIQNIVVFGVGAAGANTLLHLVYSYPDLNFTVVDFDKVENRNVDPGTQPYSKVDLNRPKTQAIQRVAFEAKKKKIEAKNMKIESVNDIVKLVPSPETTLLIDAFDNAESRNIFKKLDKSYNVIHIGFSARLTGEAAWNEVYEIMAKSDSDAAIDVCEMTIARPFIYALSAQAAIVISRFLEKGEKVNFYFDTYLKTKTYN